MRWNTPFSMKSVSFHLLESFLQTKKEIFFKHTHTLRQTQVDWIGGTNKNRVQLTKNHRPTGHRIKGMISDANTTHLTTVTRWRNVHSVPLSHCLLFVWDWVSGGNQQHSITFSCLGAMLLLLRRVSPSSSSSSSSSYGGDWRWNRIPPNEL